MQSSIAAPLFKDVTSEALNVPLVPSSNKDASPVTFPTAFSKLGEILPAPLCNAPGGPGCNFGQSAYLGGVIIADFNGDGRNDIFATNADGGPNALYLNRGVDGNGVAQFKNVAHYAGVAFPSDQAASAVAADVDNDGDIDLYISNVGFDPVLEAARSNPSMGFTAQDLALAATTNKEGYNRLLINRGRRHGVWLGFKDVTFKAKVQGEASTRSATPSFVDFDNDGDLDLFIAAHKNVFFVFEPTHFPFSPLAPLSKRVANPACLADGDLSDCKPQSGPLLLKNMLKETGKLKFKDVTKRLRNAIDTSTGKKNVGADGRPFIDSYMVFDGQWFDYDNNGYPDLVTANDAGTIGVYRNINGRKFEYVTTSALTNTQNIPRQNGLNEGAIGAWMAISHGDVNGDGKLDFYATNAGSIVIGGTAFTQGHHALYLNVDGKNFVDVAGEIAKDTSFTPPSSLGNPGMDDGTGTITTSVGHFAFGGQLFDMDNDGDLDVVNFGNLFGSGVGTRQAATGTGTPFDPVVSPSAVTNRGTLFENKGTTEVKTVGGFVVNLPVMKHLTASQADRAKTGLDTPSDSRGLAIGDLNNDGLPDIVVYNVSGTAADGFSPFAKLIGDYKGSLVVYQNQGRANDNKNKSLVLRLRGTKSNRNGIGARVIVKMPGGKKLLRELSSNAGHRGNASLELPFGVGRAHYVNLNIRWPSGIVQKFRRVPVSRKRNCFTVIEKRVKHNKKRRSDDDDRRSGDGDRRSGDGDRSWRASMKRCR